MLLALLRSLRPVQWVKNLFVLAPIVFAGELADREALLRSLAAFAVFAAASSAVYLVNDLRDREADRLHPLKRHRPIAAGTLPAGIAWAAAGVLFALAGVGAFAFSVQALALVGTYAAVNLLYSAGLKHIVILDVMIVSLGFVLRVLAGGAAARVPVSDWLALCTFLLALFLALSKRRHEVVLLAGDAAAQRRVLDSYSPAFLDKMINVVTASALIAYALYAIDPGTRERFGGEGLIYTIPLVVFGIFRYLYLVYQAPEERNPTEALLTDLPFLANLALWGLVVLAIIYRPWP